MFYVYILKTNSEKLYIGYTNDLKKRIEQHSNGESGYTKKDLPVKLIYYEAYASERDAKKREIKLKGFKNSYSHLKKRIQDSIKS